MRLAQSVFVTLLVLTAYAATPKAWLGFGYTLHNFGPGSPVRQWLYVQQIAPGSPATDGGLHVQDAIIAINRKPVAFPSAKSALDYFRSIKPGAVLRLDVIRQEKRIVVTIRTRPMPDDYARSAVRNDDLAAREDSKQRKTPGRQ
jgi:C-terminal processing protease CtpA/Prc